MHTFTLPSGPEVGIVEMTGAEGELLAKRRLITGGVCAPRTTWAAACCRRVCWVRWPFRSLDAGERPAPAGADGGAGSARALFRGLSRGASSPPANAQTALRA